jgi:hypothetical protein
VVRAHSQNHVILNWTLPVTTCNLLSLQSVPCVSNPVI